jgi:hypothetical protein
MAGSARGADARQEHRYGLTPTYHLAAAAAASPIRRSATNSTRRLARVVARRLQAARVRLITASSQQGDVA